MGRNSLSVAMCTFNGEAFLAKQLETIAAQTLAPDELVVCDDCSTDGTQSLLDSFARCAPFKVRLFLNKERRGVARNFEQAIQYCVGDLIFLADQDDAWHLDKLRQLTESFKAGTDVGLGFCDLNIVDESFRKLRRTQWEAVGFSPAMMRSFANGKAFEALLRYNVVNGNAMGFRSSLRKYLFPIGEGWMHDEWIALIASAFSTIVPVMRPLVDYRQHPSQEVGPGKHGLVDQYRYARASMDREYFERMHRRTYAALERLQQWPGDLKNESLLPLLHARLDHVAARLQLRNLNIHRLPIVAREVLLRNYWRFGYGWKSVAQDLFL